MSKIITFVIHDSNPMSIDKIQKALGGSVSVVAGFDCFEGMSKANSLLEMVIDSTLIDGTKMSEKILDHLEHTA
jgi:hypothetical protein